jgi:hypothetical protein
MNPNQSETAAIHILMLFIRGIILYLQTELEKKIDSSIERGDYATAEKLSDHLSTRDVCYLFITQMIYDFEKCVSTLNMYLRVMCFHCVWRSLLHLT